MNKTIKQVAFLEGKKSETSISNIREVIKDMTAAIVAGAFLDRPEYATEYQIYRDKMISKAQKIVNKNPSITYEQLVMKLLGRKR